MIGPHPGLPSARYEAPLWLGILLAPSSARLLRPLPIRPVALSVFVSAGGVRDDDPLERAGAAWR